MTWGEPVSGIPPYPVTCTHHTTRVCVARLQIPSRNSQRRFQQGRTEDQAPFYFQVNRLKEHSKLLTVLTGFGSGPPTLALSLVPTTRTY